MTARDERIKRAAAKFRRRRLGASPRTVGQTNREYSERTNEGDVTQAVLLLNSPFVRGQVRSVPGSFLHSLLSTPSAPEQRIDKLFYRFLLRPPAPEERRLALRIVAGGETKAYEDLQWLLVNKVEFLFHY